MSSFSPHDESSSKVTSLPKGKSNNSASESPLLGDSNVSYSESSVYELPLNKVTKLISATARKLRLSGPELVVLCIYPTIMMVGQVMHLVRTLFLSGNELENDWLLHKNYFTQKRNIINVIFVKQGWGWTSAVYFYLIGSWVLLKISPLSPKSADGKSCIPVRKVSGSILRYLMATLWWVFFTQWFFGRPLMDRVFLATGGKCTSIAHSERLLNYIDRNPDLKNELRKIEIDSGSYLGPGPLVPNSDGISDSDVDAYEAKISSAICRRVGGNWKGGHDPSGHCFLLVHASLFLWFELLPLSVLQIRKLYETNHIFHQLVNSSELLEVLVCKWSFDLDFATFRNKAQSMPAHRPSGRGKIMEILAFLGTPPVVTWMLLGLWSWMLLITTIYFHSLPELIGGFAAGYFEIVTAIYMSRFCGQ
ncbi:Scs3 protein [Saccharomycopsis crataegensis]|uniref:Acyl-coenzyme A diphosphatase SCS3 n=1 Tax=Saccharomycopsis crataegensis TaxID=43959 RepID=A0AAV5QSK1_9ASCO|nr:Scs3 protein [Saccharomycopsis crataegensis]